jgi:hypothetical protein
VLAENLAAAKATTDDDVMRALAVLVEELKKEGIGGTSLANISIHVTGGAQGVVGAQHVTIGSLSVGKPSPPEKS